MEGPQIAALVEQLLAGEQAAATRLFEELHPRVWRLALRYTRGRQEDAKDIVQESFMKAFTHLHTLRERERFGPWLMQITATTALQRIRGGAREGRFLERWAAEQSLPGTAEDPLLRERKIAAVRQLLVELPDTPAARVVRLHYGDPPLGTAEIAERLTMPKGTVTVTLMRFRERIRETLVRQLAGLEADEQEVR